MKTIFKAGSTVLFQGDSITDWGRDGGLLMDMFPDVFGKTALITKGVGVVAATKAGVLAGGFICPPAAICIGLACVGAGLINHFGKRNWW